MNTNIRITVLLAIVFCAGISFILLRNRHGVDTIETIEMTKNNKSLNDAIPTKENVVPVYQEKVKQLTKSVENNPTNAAHMAALARLLMDGHQNGEAIRYFERALLIQPNNDSLLFDLSVCYFNEKQYTKAMAVTERILRVNKNDPKALYNKAMILATEGNTVEAERVLRHLISIAPQSEEAIQAKAHFLPSGKP